jgi:hypothetical protein
MVVPPEMTRIAAPGDALRFEGWHFRALAIISSN